MLLKPVAELALCSLGGARFARRRHAGQTIVLAYHNVVPHGAPVSGDNSLHLAQRDFAAQLDQLISTHDVIPLSQLRNPASTNRPRAVVTFDDAYRGALTAGVSELAKRRLPATIFVAPAFIGGKSFWWDRLAAAGSLTAEARERALEQLAGRDEAVRATEASVPVMPDHAVAASEAELESAQATGLITLASHTWSHPNLAGLGQSDVERELKRSLEWLNERYSVVLPWISYPYGLHTGDVERIARDVGYEGAFLISGGYVQSGQLENARYALPRLNVPAGVTVRGFALRTSGLLNR